MENPGKDLTRRHRNLLYDKEYVTIEWGREDYLINGWRISGCVKEKRAIETNSGDATWQA